jgi:hypothetical protein
MQLCAHCRLIPTEVWFSRGPGTDGDFYAAAVVGFSFSFQAEKMVLFNYIDGRSDS